MLKTDLKAEATKTRRLNLYPNTVDCPWVEEINHFVENLAISRFVQNLNLDRASVNPMVLPQAWVSQYPRRS